MTNRGFSLIEVLVAMVFLSVAILSLLELNRMSNKMTMDAYYEFMALQLAKEPIEIFRGFGYNRLKTIEANPIPDFPINEKKNLSGLSATMYPKEIGAFDRLISLQHEETTRADGKKGKAYRVKVTITPSDESWVKIWLTRKAVTLEAFVWEQPL